MQLRTLICSAALVFAVAVPVFADTAVVAEPYQVVSFSEEPDPELAIELNSQKIITDSFSFKGPDDWRGSCVMAYEGDNLNIYDKTAYAEDGSGLLFTISCYEDVDYRVLKGCTILGFCENRIYILEAHYQDYLDGIEDPEAGEKAVKTCEEAARYLKKHFVTYVKDSTEE